MIETLWGMVAILLAIFGGAVAAMLLLGFLGCASWLACAAWEWLWKSGS